MNTNNASGNFVDIPLDSESDKSQFDYTELIPGNASDVSDLTDYGDHDQYKPNDSVDAFIKSSSDEDEPVVLNELFANETNKCETESNKDNASLNVLTTISDTFVKIFYSMNNEDPSDYNNDNNNNMSFDSITNSNDENHFDNDSDNNNNNNNENEIDSSSNNPKTYTVFDDDWRSNFPQLELTRIDDNFRNKEIDDYYIEVSDSDND